MSNCKKLHGGKLYLPSDKELMKEQLACLDKLREVSAQDKEHYKNKQ